MILSFFIAVLVAASLTAAHPQSRQKRSFHAPSRGRGLSPQQEFARTHRKYGWNIIDALGDPPSYSSVASSPASTSTSIVYPAAATGTGTGGSYAPTSYGPPTWANSTLTSSGAASGPTDDPGSEDGEVIANPEPDESEYLSPVTVGGQKLNLNFDTGSADLWVFSTSLSKSDISGHSTFNPRNSLTWTEYPGATWEITYGDSSSARGTVGFDTVDVGGSTVHQQCVEIATDVSSQFVQDANSDGLLGLAFSSISTVIPRQQKTFFESVMGDLTEPLFTADLEESDGKATYEFGKIDASKYHGKINYTPIDNSEGWWQFDSPSYAVDGVSAPCTVCNPVIADTGTTLIYMDSDIVSTYYESVTSVKETLYGYAHLCDETLPSFSVAIGDGYVATVNGSDMSYASLEDGTGYCMGGLQAGPGQFQILGGVFLKQFFTVFDGGNLKFGVALKN